MSDERQVRIIRISELRENTIYDNWEAGDEIGRMPPERRETVLDNPLITSEDDPAQVIVTIGDRVVGRVNLLVSELSIRREPVKAVWGWDLLVDPTFRRMGLGWSAMSGWIDSNPIVLGCGISVMSRPMYRDWMDFQMPRFLAVRRSRPVLERFLRFRPVAAAAAAVLDAGLSAQRFITRSRRRSGLTLEELQSAPSEMDELLRPRDDRVTPHRSAAWVNWVMTHAFEGYVNPKRGLFLVKDGTGEPVAYFLTRSRFFEEMSQYQIRNIHLGTLLDWRIFDERRLGTFDIAMFALETLLAGGDDVVEICTPDAETSKRLSQFGFPKVGVQSLLAKAAPGSALDDPALQRPENWVLRPGESDMAFY